MKPIWLVLTLVVAFAYQGTLRANHAEDPYRPGRLAGEPSGLSSVVIERETLIIDLRPLATRLPALIEATYQLRNEGKTYTGELIFVAGSAVKPEDTLIQLDGQIL